MIKFDLGTTNYWDFISLYYHAVLRRILFFVVFGLLNLRILKFLTLTIVCTIMLFLFFKCIHINEETVKKHILVGERLSK